MHDLKIDGRLQGWKIHFPVLHFPLQQQSDAVVSNPVFFFIPPFLVSRNEHLACN